MLKLYSVSPVCSFPSNWTSAAFSTFTVISRAVISRLPFAVFTSNCPVTSFPSASFTIALPLIAFVMPVVTSVLFGSLVVSPLTVYSFPFTVNVVASNPVALFSVPSYVLSVLLFAVTVISYLAVRSVIFSLPAFWLTSV